MAGCTSCPGNSPHAAIVGDNYRLHTAWHAVDVYRYRDGQFTLLRHPIHDHIIAHLLHGLALLAVVFRAIPDLRRLRTRYRHGLPPFIPDKTYKNKY